LQGTNKLLTKHIRKA